MDCMAWAGARYPNKEDAWPMGELRIRLILRHDPNACDKEDECLSSSMHLIRSRRARSTAVHVYVEIYSSLID